MSLLQQELRTRVELTKEERSLLAKTLDKSMDAISLEDAIASAVYEVVEVKGQDKPRLLRMGHAAGKMVRQLMFWNDKGEDEDDFIHKTKREWATSDARLTEGELRTATKKLKAHGVLETKEGYRPSDRRQTVYYRLNMWETLRVAFTSEIATLEARLSRESRAQHRKKLARRLSSMKATLRDLELQFVVAEDDPDDDWLNDCERCGDEFCEGERCLYDETAYGWHDEDTPDLTDEDAPESVQEVELDWLPQDLDTDDTSSDYPGHNDSLPQPLYQPTPDKQDPLQKNTQKKTAEEPLLQSGATALSGRTPQQHFEKKEEKSPPLPERIRDAMSTEQYQGYARTVAAEKNNSLFAALIEKVAKEVEATPEECQDTVGQVVIEAARELDKQEAA